LSKNHTDIKTDQLETKRCGEYLLLETGNTEQQLLFRSKYRRHALQLSKEEAVRLEIIHEKLKFFAVNMYLDIEEQIETV